MRPRAAYMLLIPGFFLSLAIIALVLPKLTHLAGTPAPSLPSETSKTTVTILSQGTHHDSGHHGWFSFTHVLWVLLFSALAGAIVFGRWVNRTVRERLENRLTREYGLYELHLSLHDETREQDLVDMVEAFLHAVREFPEQRSRDGQPFIAIEAHYGPGLSGELEWSLCVRCEQTLVETIDGIISAAYPNVRIGYEFTGPPKQVDGAISQPGHVLRFRKARSFIYPIASEVAPGAARPLEAIAQAQAALGIPSTVRFQMIPCALTVERYARDRLRSHEERLSVGDGGSLGSLNRSEMTAAAISQDHAWCWLELQIASDSRENANRIAAAVLARRAENRLQRRWMIVRQDTYRRRFPTAYPPLLPSPSLRTLTSSSEIAHLIALPGARLKNVPVRRLALPRIPAPPELGTTPGEPTPQLPPQPTQNQQQPQ